MPNITLILGDAIEVLGVLPEKSVNCVVTGPPAWGLVKDETEGVYGREDTVEEYVDLMSSMMEQIYRILSDDGVVFYFAYDVYAGKKRWDEKLTPIPSQCKQGELILIPWLLAKKFSSIGWFVMSDIIWHRTNPMPRKQKGPIHSHVYIWLLAKTRQHFWNRAAVTVENRTAVWRASSRQLLSGYEWVVFPETIVENCIRLGTPPHGVVLDPFVGSGTTCLVADNLGFDSIGIDRDIAAINFAAARVNIRRTLFAHELRVFYDFHDFKPYS